MCNCRIAECVDVLLRQQPYRNFVTYKNLLDIEKYASLKTLAKAQRRILSVSRVRENFMYGGGTAIRNLIT
ncbi:hypothetical protein DN748_13855 [Sinomicrobium soli]|nr:hypothetical protein DN748_13855 [Sinomicrobium sp. N-1-3-6]